MNVEGLRIVNSIEMGYSKGSLDIWKKCISLRMAQIYSTNVDRHLKGDILLPRTYVNQIEVFVKRLSLKLIIINGRVSGVRILCQKRSKRRSIVSACPSGSQVWQNVLPTINLVQPKYKILITKISKSWLTHQSFRCWIRVSIRRGLRFLRRGFLKVKIHASSGIEPSTYDWEATIFSLTYHRFCCIQILPIIFSIFRQIQLYARKGYKVTKKLKLLLSNNAAYYMLVYSNILILRFWVGMVIL